MLHYSKSISHADADAEKRKCADLGNYSHPYECRKRCPRVGPHYGHETEKFVDLVTDKGTCDEGLKCCQIYFYNNNSGLRTYTNTGSSWPTENFQWCWFFETCKYP